MDAPNLIFGLQSDWAILLAIFILTSVQFVKVLLDGTKTKREKLDRKRTISTLDNIDVYLRILSDKYTEEVTERQLPVILKEFLGHCKEAIIVQAAASITRNDVVNNEREVTAKLTQYIHNHFHSAQVNLSLFKWKGRLLAEFTKTSWCEKVTDGVIEVVIQTTRKNKMEAYRQLDSFMQQKFDSFLTDALSSAYEA